MKILQVNVVYPGGSTGRLTESIHLKLKAMGHESVVYYARGPVAQDTDAHKIMPELLFKAQALMSRITGFRYGSSCLSTALLKNAIKRENPDIVHLHCINANTVAIHSIINFLKRRGVKTVVTLHAEFLYTGGCAYAFDCPQFRTECVKCPVGQPRFNPLLFDMTNREFHRFKRAYEGFDDITFVGVSGWVASRAKESALTKNNKVISIDNGINIDVFKPSAISSVEEKFNLKGKKVILHVGYNFDFNTDRGQYLIDLAARFEGQDDVKFVVVGASEDNDAYRSNIATIKVTANQQQLAELYSAANLTLLLSKRETFSMVCAESITCGTPIVGFEAGAPETISIPEYSEFVKYGDVDALEVAIGKWLNYKQSADIDQMAREAREKYDRGLMVDRYLELYTKIIEG